MFTVHSPATCIHPRQSVHLKFNTKKNEQDSIHNYVLDGLTINILKGLNTFSSSHALSHIFTVARKLNYIDVHVHVHEAQHVTPTEYIYPQPFLAVTL